MLLRILHVTYICLPWLKGVLGGDSGDQDMVERLTILPEELLRTLRLCTMEESAPRWQISSWKGISRHKHHRDLPDWHAVAHHRWHSPALTLLVLKVVPLPCYICVLAPWLPGILTMKSLPATLSLGKWVYMNIPRKNYCGWDFSPSSCWK